MRLDSFVHDEAAQPVLRDLSFDVAAGEVLAVTGPSGSGKSTLGQILGGILPSEGGVLRGELELDGQRVVFDAGPAPSVDRAAWGRAAAYLPQDVRLYLSGARATAAEEVAFGLEYRGVSRREQREAVAQVLGRLGLEHLADRDPLALSGGQERLVAFAALLVGRPGVVVLDEPGAGLDDAALKRMGDAVRAACAQGTAVVLLAGYSEHLAGLADRTVSLGEESPEPSPASVEPAEPSEPLVHRAGTSPMGPASEASGTRSSGTRQGGDGAPPVLELRDFSVVRGPGRTPVVRGLDLGVRAGQCLAVTGPNGVGKTTLLRGIMGLERSRGRRRLRGRDLPQRPSRTAREVAVMFQNPADQLTETTLDREVRAVLPRASTEEVERVLAAVGLVGQGKTHPYELPAAQKRLLCLAQVLARRTPLVLLDEPGVGLDEAGRRILVARLRQAMQDGVGILLVTHDRALVHALADQEVRLG